MKDSYKLTLAGACAAGALMLPMFASAATEAELRAQIQGLMEQIKSLQQQLLGLRMQRATSTATTTPPQPKREKALCFEFKRDIRMGMRGEDVRELQKQLAEAFDDDDFRPEHVTGFFGPKSQEALVRMQKKLGLVAAGTATSTVGFGPKTRMFFKEHCDNGLHMGWGRAMMGGLKDMMEKVKDMFEPRTRDDGKPGTGMKMNGVGTISAVSGSVITLKAMNGAMRQVLVASTTEIVVFNASSTLPVPGGVGDLAVGDRIEVRGVLNADDSIAAQAIREMPLKYRGLPGGLKGDSHDDTEEDADN